MKTITIRGASYVEAKPDRKRAGPLGEVCSQCAFGMGRLGACAEAIERSPEVFGGDCAERDVIYVRPAPSIPQKEEV